ncbi:MAG TPA: HAD-IIIA family hydrolase [Gammaproteobacteria bacterium]|nr:HAD-IIIA family hydrolase [Gammaproteobacteria bacterium]
MSNVRAKRPALFIDKDGTLIEDVPYNVDPARIRLVQDMLPLLAAARDAGAALILVSNQAGVALGRFAPSALICVVARVQALLAPHGLALDDALFCPHLPDAPVARYARVCDCRKPAPGLLLQAAARHDLDLGASWLVGDILDDVEAAHRAGCRAIFFDRGHETEWRRGTGRVPDRHVRDPREALDIFGARATECAA